MISPDNFETATLRESRRSPGMTHILSAALQAVDPAAAVRRAASSLALDLQPGGGVFVVAIGKASVPMAAAMTEILGEKLSAGVIVTKHAPPDLPSRFTVIEGGHPVPDENSLRAGAEIRGLLTGLNAADVVIHRLPTDFFF